MVRRWLLWAAVLAALVTLLFPPMVINAGGRLMGDGLHFLLEPDYHGRIDTTRLFLEWAVLGVLATVVYANWWPKQPPVVQPPASFPTPREVPELGPAGERLRAMVDSKQFDMIDNGDVVAEALVELSQSVESLHRSARPR